MSLGHSIRDINVDKNVHSFDSVFFHFTDQVLIHRTLPYQLDLNLKLGQKDLWCKKRVKIMCLLITKY